MKLSKTKSTTPTKTVELSHPSYGSLTLTIRPLSGIDRIACETAFNSAYVVHVNDNVAANAVVPDEIHEDALRRGQDAYNAEFLIRTVTGWAGVEDENGKVVPFTVAAFTAACEAFPALAYQAYSEVMGLRLSRRDEKNSGSPSSSGLTAEPSVTGESPSGTTSGEPNEPGKPSG